MSNINNGFKANHVMRRAEILDDAGLQALAHEVGDELQETTVDAPEIAQRWADERRPLFETNYDPNIGVIGEAGLPIELPSVRHLA